MCRILRTILHFDGIHSKKRWGAADPHQKDEYMRFSLRKTPCSGLFQWMLHAALSVSDASAGGADCMEAPAGRTMSMIWAVIHCVPLFQ